MASIHWLAWLTIGLIVIFTSLRIGGNIEIFMWVGLVFLLIGIAKLVHRVVFTPREKPKQEAKQHHAQQNHAHQRANPIRCPRCMTLAHPLDNYCRVCGTALRTQAPHRQVVR